MGEYNDTRQHYRPEHIKLLLIAESPPPAGQVGGSRHFYRTDKQREGDRLFINTIKALYPEASGLSWQELERDKENWLRRFQADGRYMIEALEASLPHSVSKPERKERIKKALPSLLKRIAELVFPDTKIILIKSNVFEVAAQPLQQAGYNIINTSLVDYPGQYNQSAYREKLAALAKQS